MRGQITYNGTPLPRSDADRIDPYWMPQMAISSSLY